MRMHQLSRRKVLRIVGIMNGTSIDGIDFVLTSVQKKGSQVQVKYLDQASISFPKSLSEKLYRAARHELKVDELSLLHHELGRYYAKTLSEIKKKKKWSFQLVGLHGQTVFHKAPEATLQIGESSYLSSELKVPVVSDFRVADLALGGQGAPIASLFHKVAFGALKKKNKAWALHNLGGISNLTVITRSGKVERAFDTGPANMLMDLFVKQKSNKTYDANGAWASQGIPYHKVIDEFLEEKFFKKKPPKSCGREEFGEAFLNKLIQKINQARAEDQLATLVEFTARSIAYAYHHHVKSTPTEILLCGGGAKNHYLKKRIQFHLPELVVKTTEDYGWPSQAIEGGAFALLAAYRLWNMPSNLPETTGAQRSVTLGKVTEAF